jgi:ferric-dicitrate binding protein FerR (iron transport regulator)
VTTPDDLELDRIHALMMAALDGECSSAEREELDRLIAARLDIADEWNRLRRLKEVTVTMDLRQPPQEVWDHYRASVLHRTERSVAWMLILLGGVVLGVGALWRALAGLFANWSNIPLEVRVGGTGLVVGAVLLIVSILRERWVLHSRDPYSKEITR